MAKYNGFRRQGRWPLKFTKKNQRDLNAWEQPSVDFFSENSNKVPLWNTLLYITPQHWTAHTEVPNNIYGGKSHSDVKQLNNTTFYIHLWILDSFNFGTHWFWKTLHDLPPSFLVYPSQKCLLLFGFCEENFSQVFSKKWPPLILVNPQMMELMGSLIFVHPETSLVHPVAKLFTKRWLLSGKTNRIQFETRGKWHLGAKYFQLLFLNLFQFACTLGEWFWCGC